MKVNLDLSSQSADVWDRVLAGDFSRPPAIPDWQWVEGTLAMDDLAEPLGFDCIWASQHFGSPYDMVPNPLQLLTWFAGAYRADRARHFRHRRTVVAPCELGPRDRLSRHSQASLRRKNVYQEP